MNIHIHIFLVSLWFTSENLASTIEASRLPKGETQIMVDDRRISHKEGVIRRVHAGRKLDNPVLVSEMPWELSTNDRRVYTYGTVLATPGGDGFRMWYERFNRQLYATSADGIRWTRPQLGLVEFEGSRKNNILPIDLHSSSVVLDAKAEPAKRYKMFGYHRPTKSYHTAYSSDGLNWKQYEHGNPFFGGDTCTLAQDPKTGEFLAFHKKYREHRGHKRRLVYLSISKDMQTWTEPKLVMAPDEIDDHQTQTEGGQFSEFYNMSAFPWGGQWLGMVTHFRYTGPPTEIGPAQSNQNGITNQSPHDGPIDAQLVYSRDGRTWNRLEDRSPVIPNGPHEYDAGTILGVCNAPVVVGEEMWMYYTAITTTHGGYLPRKKITVARAAWRLDGMVSLEAGTEGGTVTTVLLRPAGQHLFVNTDAAQGELKVEILDEAENPLPGYGEGDLIPVRSDTVRQPVHWKGNKTLPPDRPIRLRFRLSNAHLFSYVIR